MGTKFDFDGEFRLILCSKWVPRVMGNIKGLFCAWEVVGIMGNLVPGSA